MPQKTVAARKRPGQRPPETMADAIKSMTQQQRDELLRRLTPPQKKRGRD